jgi:hypothetical protein
VVVKAAGKYADAVSFNWYGSWTPDPVRMANWERWAGKPFLVTEWYAKGADAPGLANTTGAGWLVRTQRDRGAYYQNFALGLLRSKACLGWHWFKYQDNDPSDTTTDPSNRDANKGMVDADYKPYADLAGAMRDLNREAYSLVEFFDGRSWTGVKRSRPRARAAGTPYARATHPGWLREGPREALFLDALGRWEPWPGPPRAP